MMFTWNPNWPYPFGKSWEPELLGQEYEGFVSKHDPLVCGILTANHSHQYIYIYMYPSTEPNADFERNHSGAQMGDDVILNLAYLATFWES